MATISEMLLGQAAQASNQTSDILGGVKQGAALAQQVQDVQLKRQQIEAQKQQLEADKLNAMTNDIMKAKTLGGKSLSGYKEYLKNKARVLKIDGIYTPEAIELITAAPDNMDRFAVLVDDVRNQRTDLPTAMKTLQDEGIFYNLDPAERQRLEAASQFAAEQQGLTKRAELAAQLSSQKTASGQEGQAELDERKKTNELWTAYKASGGEAGTKSRIAKLKEVKALLQEKKILFGNIGKKIPFGGDLDVLARTDPKAKAAIDTVRSSINVKMRTGDPNPTQNQIDQIYNQAIDPRLDNEANIKKLDAEIAAEEMAEKNAREQFIRVGILKENKKAKDKTFNIRGRELTVEQLKALPDAAKALLPDEVKKEIGVM